MIEWLLAGLVVVAVLAAGMFALALHGVDAWTRPPRTTARDHPRNYGLSCEEIEFGTRDGVRLHGWFVAAAPAAKEGGHGKTAVIICHGHGGDKSPHAEMAPWFHERGLPVLLFDFRNHGLSDGVLTSMGYYERRDLLAAIDSMYARGHTRIGLYGFSMGAATAMATAPLSEHVVCVVADSGFAKLRPTLVRALEQRVRVKPLANRLVDLIWWLGERRLHCDLDEAEPLRAVRQFGKRALFIIHGTRDDYIDVWQAQALYDAATGPKELWIAPEAMHTEIARLHPKEYRARVVGFFEEYLKR